MKALSLVAACVVPGGLLVAVVAWIMRQRRQQAWREAANYVQAIQVWAPETPLALPPIRPLVARVDRWPALVRRQHER